MTFLETTKDVYDEATGAFAETALALAAGSGSPLSGKALEYAAEALKVSEESRARSLLDLLSETSAEVTEGVPQDLLTRKRANHLRIFGPRFSASWERTRITISFSNKLSSIATTDVQSSKSRR